MTLNVFSALRLPYLQSILDCTRDALIVAEIDREIGIGHRICFVNDAFTKLTGYTLADIGGKPFTFLGGPQTETGSIARLKAAFERRDVTNLKILIYSKLGECFTCDVTVYPQADGDDCDYFVVRFHRLDDDRKDKTIDRFSPDGEVQALADSLSEAVLIHRNKHPLFANTAYMQLFGYTSREEALRESSPLMNLEPDQIGADRPLRCELMRTDGQPVHVLVRGKPIDWAGAPADLLTISRSAPAAPKPRLPALPGSGPAIESADQATLLRELMDTLPVALVHKTSDLKYTYVNKTYADWVEMTPEQIVGRHVSQVRNEAHFQLMRQRRDEVLSGKIVQYVTKTEFPRRGLCDLLTTLVPRWEPDGSIKSYFTFAQDITEFMDVERALTEREQQLRLVMDSVPALISYRDRNLFYKYVNQPYADWYGCRREDIIGRHMASFMRLVEFRAMKPCLDRVLAGERVRQEFGPGTIRIGKPAVTVDFVPHEDENGLVVGFFALAQEIVSPKSEHTGPEHDTGALSNQPPKSP